MFVNVASEEWTEENSSKTSSETQSERSSEIREDNPVSETKCFCVKYQRPKKCYSDMWDYFTENAGGKKVYVDYMNILTLKQWVIWEILLSQR